MQKLQRAGDFEGMKQARASFQALREKYGISTALPLFSLLQVNKLTVQLTINRFHF